MARRSESGTRIEFRIAVGQETVTGDLSVPASPKGVVLFAQGGDGGRASPRNQYIANTLERRGLATLLIDLLTPKEQLLDRETIQFRFDIPLLADRVMRLIEWIRGCAEVSKLPIGLFGTATGGSAALFVAGEWTREIGAVVSRGGRPDLVGPALTDVTAPTLLLVGSRDIVVARINREALAFMRGTVSLEVIEDATHLFAEPGALESVAELSAKWFSQHLHAIGARAVG